jgi:hypothetical protein
MESLIKNLNRFSVLILSGLIDWGFVFLWLVTQWVVSQFVVGTRLVSGLDRWMVVSFQVVFALSTFIPIALYVIRDLIIGMRRWAQIQEGIDRS